MGNEGRMFSYPLFDNDEYNYYSEYKVSASYANSYGNTISCHPYKNEVARLRSSHMAEGIDFNAILFSINSRINSSDWFKSIEYSPDGNVAINRYQTGYVFVKPSDKTMSDKEDERCCCEPLHLSIAFHKNKVLAAILTNDATVQFLDYTKNIMLKKIKFEKPELVFNNGFHDAYILKLLSFTPDGKKLVTAIGNKFFVYPLPLDLIYMGKFKEDFIKTRWFLKNVCDGKIQLSSDVINVITDLLLDVVDGER
jgi:hypothetical protein